MDIINALITSKNRPLITMKATSVTMHNTGNPNSTAMNNRHYFQDHPKAQVSAHWVVDDVQAVLCVPENEIAWHAGTKANQSSIGVEVCEFTDPKRQAKANDNAAELVAQILKRTGLQLENITTHKAWTGKNCPMLLLPMWNQFLSMVATHYGPRLVLSGKATNIELVIIDGRTYAQVRGLLEHEGYTVGWDEVTKTVIGTRR